MVFKQVNHEMMAVRFKKDDWASVMLPIKQSSIRKTYLFYLTYFNKSRMSLAGLPHDMSLYLTKIEPLLLPGAANQTCLINWSSASWLGQNWSGSRKNISFDFHFLLCNHERVSWKASMKDCSTCAPLLFEFISVLPSRLESVVRAGNTGSRTFCKWHQKKHEVID